MRTYLRQRRKLLWWLTALALFFAAYFALRTDRTAMNRLCGSVIFPAMRQVARLCDGFDGSVGEVLILTAIWAGIIWLTCTVRRLIAGPRRRAVLADFALTAACLMLTVYGGFCLLWGTAYSTDSFQDRSGIVAQPVSVEELEQVTRYFASELTAAADGVPRDDSGVCAADRKTILAAAGDAYDGVYDEFPFLRVETGGVKPFACSNALSVLRFTGFYFPFTGEANVNMDSPVAWLPSTVCHEMAHQRGVISEQECNFIGILAATRCADPVYRYSGWLEGYVYLSNALYPLSISLIALAFMDHFFNGRRCVYVWTTLFTAVPALCDGLHGFGLKLGAMEPMLAALPLAEYSMGWICFFAVGFAVGIVQMLVTGKKEQA